jgi:hypothetical protein
MYLSRPEEPLIQIELRGDSKAKANTPSTIREKDL